VILCVANLADVVIVAAHAAVFVAVYAVVFAVADLDVDKYINNTPTFLGGRF
jgi:hypothetical protein